MRTRRAAAVLCAFIFGLNIWRAARQSITIDEAFTYLEYVSQSWSSVFLKMNEANNHILFSALARLSVLAFGPSEFSLRLPSVLASALFLYCAARLAFLLAPGHLMPVLLLAVVALNPMTMDYMVAARGYSLALAFFAWSVLDALLWLKDGQNSRLLRIGVASGLCVSANLAFAFPVLAVLAVCSLIILWRGWRLLKRDVTDEVSPLSFEEWRQQTNQIELFYLPERAVLSLGLLLMPAFAVPAAIAGPALSGAEVGAFYWGAPNLGGCIRSLLVGVMLHGRTAGGPFGTSMFRSVELFIVIPAVFAAIVMSAVLWIRRRREPQLLMLTAMLIVLMLGYAVANEVLGLPYPLERTGLGLAFLFLLVWLGDSAALLRGRRLRLPGIALCVTAVVLVIQILTQIDPEYFGNWVDGYRIRDAVASVRSGSGRISAQWWYQPPVEFYRQAWNLRFAPVERVQGDAIALTGYDYYFLQNPPADRLRANHLRPVFRDQLSGLMVAVPESQRP